MKKLLFGFLTLFSFHANSQTPEIKPAKLAIGFTFSPDYCYRSIGSDPASESIKNYRDDMEIPKFGFTTGGRILFTLGNKVSLESGLLFSDKGERTKEITYRYLDYDERAPVSGKHNYHYYYLDVPVKMNYYLTSQKVKFFVSAGTSVNFFIAHKTTSTLTFADGRVEDRKIATEFAFNQVNVAALAGMGADVAISEKLSLRVEPIYRRSVVSIINTPIKSNLYSFGMNFGVFLKL